MSTRDLAKRLIPITIICIIVIAVIIKIYFPINGKLVCTYESAPGDPKAEYTYTADYKLWRVKQLETKVVITSKKKDVLNQMKEETEEATKSYMDLPFYDSKVSVSGKKLTSIITIDYSKIDYNQLAKVEGKAKINKGSLSIHTIKKSFKTIGADCKYK